MSKFKVGDRVKLSGEYGGWFSGNEGKTGTITRITHEWTYVTFDNSKGETFEDDYGNPELLELISRAPETPPTTITHEGYTYNRGERVRPEWLKDGAWVVSLGNGEIGGIVSINDNFVCVKFPGDPVQMRYETAEFAEYFRPFTDADWEWGMWAEYKGGKVFVCKRHDGGVTASRPTDAYFFIPFCQITPTTAP